MAGERGQLIPFPRKEHEEFERGLRKQFPVWYEYEDKARSSLDIVCMLIVASCVAICVGLGFWG